MGKITHLIFSEGERYPALLDDNGIPDYWATLFITVTRRPRLTASAIENTLRSILHLKLWEEAEQRDLIQEIGEGTFLNDEDINSIRDHCMHDTRSFREWQKTKTSRHQDSVSFARPKSMKTIKSVSREHFTNRITHIAFFLHFAARTALRRHKDFASLSTQIDDLKNRLLSLKRKIIKKSARGNDPDYRAPPPAIFDKLMATIKVDSPDNPYSSLDVKIRNSLMFELMYEAGIRSGEVLSLHMDDIDFHNSKVLIRRRHDDLIDPRSKQPVAKTLERDIKIPLSLTNDIHNYIMKVRATIKGANNPFIFVTHKPGKYSGCPISETSFRNRIVKHATEQFPDIFGEIHRHGFRHNFNYKISKRVDAINLAAKSNPEISPINEKQEMQSRMYLNGWSSEGSAQIYNRRHIKETSNRVMTFDMQDQAKHIRKRG